LQEESEDTKGAIRNRISKKNRQHNGQKKKYKMANNDRQNIHIKQTGQIMLPLTFSAYGPQTLLTTLPSFGLWFFSVMNSFS
jgi:hypothetical protein